MTDRTGVVAAIVSSEPKDKPDALQVEGSKDSAYALRRLGKVGTYAEAASILRKHNDHQHKFFGNS